MTHTTAGAFPPDRPAAGVGWLIHTRHLMNSNEAARLGVLGAFDASRDRQADGYLACAQWLRHHTDMSRQTAAGKVATIDVLGRAVRHYRNCRDQNRPPQHDFERRHISIHEGYDGIGAAELVLTNADLTALRTSTHCLSRASHLSSREDTPTPATGAPRHPPASSHEDTLDAPRPPTPVFT